MVWVPTSPDPMRDRRKARLGTSLVPLHSIVVAALLAWAVGVAIVLLVLPLPLDWLAAIFGGCFLALFGRHLPVCRDGRRIAAFGSPGLIAAITREAPAHGSKVVFAAEAGPQLGQGALRFLIDARPHRAGTILLQLPTDAVALRRRLPRLVETAPARVLCAGAADAGAELWPGQAASLVASAPLSLSQHLAKRGLDLAVALPALLLLGPAMLLVGLVIRLESPGGALFRQRRIGRLGRTFVMYKFRSMREDARADGLATTRNDPRLTRLGRWLRATSIDELPQLLNVALGEMSIVGPRPHVATHRVESGVYAEVIPEYAARHRVNPGITGLAQIGGMRGGIESHERARRSVTLDLRYIDQWSLWLDIRIILRTLLTGMAGRDVF